MSFAEIPAEVDGVGTGEVSLVGPEVLRELLRAADDDVHASDVIEQRLHDDLATFVYTRLKRRPMIVPVVVEI